MEDLSRGMQQKVALARALLTDAALLLLDEPTPGLDPRSKREAQAFIQRGPSARTTRPWVLCTHDLVEAEHLADRVGILDRGRLLALETAAGPAHGATTAPTLRGGVHGRDRALLRGRRPEPEAA